MWIPAFAGMTVGVVRQAHHERVGGGFLDSGFCRNDGGGWETLTLGGFLSHHSLGPGGKALLFGLGMPSAVGERLVEVGDVDSRSFGYAQDRFRGNDGWGAGWFRGGEVGLGEGRAGLKPAPTEARAFGGMARLVCAGDFWIPACAGMTGWGCGLVTWGYGWFQARMWIPAFAGMTVRGGNDGWGVGWLRGGMVGFRQGCGFPLSRE